MTNVKNVSTQIKDVQLTIEGNLVLICTPTKQNPTGVFKMNAAQTARLCNRVGIPNAFAVKHVVAISNGTSKLNFTEEECKTGEAYTDKAGKVLGTYEKDWIKSANHEIDLGFASKMKVAEFALQASFASMQFAPVAQSRPVAAPVVADTKVDENPGV